MNKNIANVTQKYNQSSKIFKSPNYFINLFTDLMTHLCSRRFVEFIIGYLNLFIFITD